jgi:hypothetical protein
MKLQNELHLGNKILRNEEYQSLHDWLSAGNSILNTHHLRSLVPFLTPKGPKFLLGTIEN